MKKSLLFLLVSFFLFKLSPVQAQDARAQYPGLLRKAYFGVNLGYINYPFSNEHLAPGYQSSHVQIPNLGIRITLLGYQFTPAVSAQITYMRPFNWVEYENINNDKALHSVWMNVGGLTVKGRLPLGKKLALSGEGGLAVVTRNGFEINQVPVVRDVSFATALVGGALEYRLNKKFDLNVSTVYTPERKKVAQPSIVFASAGFTYHMQPLSAERVLHNSDSRYRFPKNLLQFGYTTNELGYGVNKLVSEGAIPIFWGGEAHVKRGVALNYQRNVFHTRKVFSLDVGVSTGYWKSRLQNQDFYSLSIYPLMRFTALRTRPMDIYFNYSVAGPSFISRTQIDGKDTGKKFTFRDYMGMGLYAGKERKLNAEVNIGHFSNGNIFPSNAGVKIPLGFHLGYAF